jgi:hypothetical protein
MPTYHVTWTAGLRGHSRVDANNADDAAQMFLDAEPQLGPEMTVSEIEVVHVEEADPGITWR